MPLTCSLEGNTQEKDSNCCCYCWDYGGIMVHNHIIHGSSHVRQSMERRGRGHLKTKTHKLDETAHGVVGSLMGRLHHFS
mmetsp:Transcript_33337/g.59725  ORF Transcript_33337/g.59725 Transcript_33337/m.59725 type:complete len:80 (-) Transcript_33337:11396-11635(-)